MVTSVQYKFFDAPFISDECVICRDTLRKGQYVVGHSGNHPHLVHKKCLETWVKVSRTCPICRSYIDTLPPPTWKEKLVSIVSFAKVRKAIADSCADGVGSLTNKLDHFITASPRLFLLITESLLGGMGLGVFLGAMKTTSLVSGVIPVSLVWVTTVGFEFLLLVLSLLSLAVAILSNYHG